MRYLLPDVLQVVLGRIDFLLKAGVQVFAAGLPALRQAQRPLHPILRCQAVLLLFLLLNSQRAANSWDHQSALVAQ